MNQKYKPSHLEMTKRGCYTLCTENKREEVVNFPIRQIKSKVKIPREGRIWLLIRHRNILSPSNEMEIRIKNIENDSPPNNIQEQTLEPSRAMKCVNLRSLRKPQKLPFRSTMLTTLQQLFLIKKIRKKTHLKGVV